VTDFLTQLSSGADGRLVCTGADYIEFDIRLARDGSCPTATKAAYMALAAFADTEDHTTLSAEVVAGWSEEVRHRMLPYRKTIAACMGRSTRTFDRAAADLEDRQFLMVEAQCDPGNAGVSEANLYRLTDRERWARQLLERAANRTPGQLLGPDGRPLPRVLRDPGVDFIKLDARMVCIGHRSPNYKAVYAAVASFTNMHSRAITERPPTLKELMACTGLGRTAVTEALAQMRKDGLLETRANYLPASEGGGKTASSYLLLDGRLWRRRVAAREDAEMHAFAGGSTHQSDGGLRTTRTGVPAPAGRGSTHQPDDITRSSTRRGDERLPDARRASTGGLARAARGTGAGSRPKPNSGSAAAKTIRTTASRPVPREQEVFAMVDALHVSKHLAIRVPPLRRAVRELLSAGRTPEHALARINDGWWRAGVPEKIARREIRGPVGYLAAILSAQDCERPDCERGVILGSGEECRACGFQAAQRHADRARVDMERDTAALDQAARETAVERSAAGEPSPVFRLDAGPVTWRCEAPGPDGLGTGPCGRPGRGTPPALPMCPDCLTALHLALAG